VEEVFADSALSRQQSKFTDDKTMVFSHDL
jgi:hypothetical protein